MTQIVCFADDDCGGGGGGGGGGDDDNYNGCTSETAWSISATNPNRLIQITELIFKCLLSLSFSQVSIFSSASSTNIHTNTHNIILPQVYMSIVGFQIGRCESEDKIF
jgi:hypothetical protein